MRQNAAFKFIPELIGDFAHVMKLSRNPKLLYVEAAVGSLHMATNVFTALEEHENTKDREKTAQDLREKYSALEKKRFDDLEEETVRKLDVTYEKVKSKIIDGRYRDNEVREFIKCIREGLYKAIDIFNSIQIDPDYPDKAIVEETSRRTLRAYNNLLKVFIEEGE